MLSEWANRREKNTGKALRRLQGAFWLLAVLPLLWVILTRSREILDQLETVAWHQVILPLFLLVLILPLMAANSWVSLRFLRGGFSFFEAAGIYFSSQGPKYLPGGFWAFPSRVVFYASRGMQGADSMLSVVREVAALFLGAAAVGALGAAYHVVSTPLRWAITAGASVSFAVIALTSTAWFWRIIARFFTAINLPFEELMHDPRKRSLRWLPSTFAVSVLFWLALGIPFRSLVTALAPSVSLTWLQAASVFALAWCGGFVFVILPAGLGVRETVLTLILNRWMPEDTAFTVALAARAWWMLAELVYIMISFTWLIRTTRFSPLLSRFWNQGRGEVDVEPEEEEPSSCQ